MSEGKRRAVYAKNAQRDLQIQADYIETEGGLLQSERFVEAVSRTVELLRDTPQIGRLIRPGAVAKAELRSIGVSRPFDKYVVFIKFCEAPCALNGSFMVREVLEITFPNSPRFAIHAHLSDNREWP